MLQRDEVSRTARLVAACRAIDAEREPAARFIRFADRFGAELCGPEPLALAAALPALVDGIGLRTRWLDEELGAFAAKHAGAQVVLLGAGLDTRALRLDLAARFFEIDLPGMLEMKAAVLPPVDEARRVLLPVDLRDQRFADALAACPAFVAGAPTCVVWEGVSYYLPEAAIAATLEQLAAVLPPGDAGLLLFDHVKQSWLDAVKRRNVGGVVAQVAAWREPMIYGFPDVAATLAAHGLELVYDHEIDEVARLLGLTAPADRWYAGIMAGARRPA